MLRRRWTSIVAETAFQVVYEGPALADGRMPVRQLAPALLALGELFNEASTVAHPDREPASLSIKATEKGSFEAHLILEAKHIWDQVVDIFGSDGATAIVNLKEVVLAGGIGLFWAIKKIRRRKVTEREQLSSGSIRVTLEDGETFEVPADVLKLYDRITIRKKARMVLEPLTRDGIEEVRFQISEESTLTVSSSDLPAFELGDDESTSLGEQDREMVLQIASVAFMEGNKWRLTDGASTFWAAMEDDSFLARVEGGEAFRKGDMLRCDLNIIQTQDAEGTLHAEHRVVRVLEHLPRPTQLTFEAPEAFDGPEDSSLPKQLPPGSED
jgi:hypothetical protein